MSVKLMSRVWDDAPVEGSELLLMLALADSANDEGVCWPSQETLSRKTRINKRHVQRLLSRLAAAGMIEVSPRFAGGSQTSNSYRIIAPPTTPRPSPHDSIESSPPRLPDRPPTTLLSRPPHDSIESYRTVIEPSNNRHGEPLPPPPFKVGKKGPQR